MKSAKVIKSITKEFETKSERVIEISAEVEHSALNEFIKAKNDFEQNSTHMIELIEKELSNLHDFHSCFETNIGEKKFYAENRLMVDNSGLDKASQKTLENENFTETEADHVEHRQTKHLMDDQVYQEEFKRVRQSMAISNKLIIDVAKLSTAYLGEGHMEMLAMSKRTSIIGIHKFHPFIDTLFKQNQAFQLFPVSETGFERNRLPAFRDPNIKINLWGILKENIGKDLSRMQMPVYVKEPITLVQKISEFIEYIHLVREANRAEDPHLRIAYLAAFFIMQIAQNKHRLKVSFNSLLGETYEIVDGDLKYVTEAVSTHPPIQAFYCESLDFILTGSIYLKTNLSIASMEFQAIGNFDIYLKGPKERYKLERPIFTLHNYMLGDMYIWVRKNLTLTNLTTLDKATVTFRPKGWSSKHDYEIGGTIKTADDTVIYDILGKWDDCMSIVNQETKAETLLAKRFPDILNFENQYFFTHFGINLNHLPVNLTYKIAPTDSRLRPDVRAYEYGNLEMAAFEKNRLEENQRERRKKGEPQKPIWFSFEMNKDKTFKTEYLGQYFEARQNQRWPSETPNLFND